MSSERNVKKLTEIHRLVGKSWAQGGIVCGNDPCVEDRARQVGLSTRVLHRHGIGARWNDKQPTRTGARNVQRALKRAIAREGGECLQTETEAAAPKKTRKVRQHPGAALAVAGVALVLTMVIAAHLAVVLLVCQGLACAAALAAGLRLWFVLGVPAVEWIDEQDLGYARRVERVAVESRRDQLIQTIEHREELFALPAGQTIEAMPAWLHADEREEVPR